MLADTETTYYQGHFDQQKITMYVMPDADDFNNYIESVITNIKLKHP